MVKARKESSTVSLSILTQPTSLLTTARTSLMVTQLRWTWNAERRLSILRRSIRLLILTKWTWRLLREWTSSHSPWLPNWTRVIHKNSRMCPLSMAECTTLNFRTGERVSSWLRRLLNIRFTSCLSRERAPTKKPSLKVDQAARMGSEIKLDLKRLVQTLSWWSQLLIWD